MSYDYTQPPGRGHDAVNVSVRPDLGPLPRPPPSEGTDTPSSCRVSARSSISVPPDDLQRSPIGYTEGTQVQSEPNVGHDHTQPPGRGPDAVNIRARPDLGPFPRPRLSEGTDTPSPPRVSALGLLGDPPGDMLRGTRQGKHAPPKPSVLTIDCARPARPLRLGSLSRARRSEDYSVVADDVISVTTIKPTSRRHTPTREMPGHPPDTKHGGSLLHEGLATDSVSDAHAGGVKARMPRLDSRLIPAEARLGAAVSDHERAAGHILLGHSASRADVSRAVADGSLSQEDARHAVGKADWSLKQLLRGSADDPETSARKRRILRFEDWYSNDRRQAPRLHSPPPGDQYRQPDENTCSVRMSESERSG